MAGVTIFVSCKYNDEVECDRRDCEKGYCCGWDPEVEKARKKKLKADIIVRKRNRKKLMLPVKNELENRKQNYLKYVRTKESEEDRETDETMCEKCGNPTEGGKKWCAECLRKYREYRVRKAKRYQEQRLCIDCGKPNDSDGTARCIACLKKLSDKQKLRKEQKRTKNN